MSSWTRVRGAYFGRGAERRAEAADASGESGASGKAEEKVEVVEDKEKKAEVEEKPPVKTEEKKVEVKAEAKKPSKNSELDEALKRIAEHEAKVAELAAKLAERDARAVRQERAAYLRAAGAQLTEAQMLALAPPDADPSTEAGRKELNAFIRANSNIFVAPVEPVRALEGAVKGLAEQFKGSFSPHLQPAALDAFARRVLSGGSS